MTYATRTELVTLFGEAEVSALEDPDNTGVPSSIVSTRALEDASQEADSYIATRYVLPLPNVPAPLSRASCDIARFRLYKDRPTEEVKYRYERTIKWLEHLAVGKVLLTFDPVLSTEQTQALTKPVTPVGVKYAGGVFSDEVLGRMPALK